MSFVRLTETAFPTGALRVDEEAGIIHGVRILGRVSKRGREYSDRAMDDAAALYEGIDVNIDHPTPDKASLERRFTDGIGVIRHSHRIPDGVEGDLHYIKSHPMAAMLVESAQRFPHRFGLSHHADGKQVRRNGKQIVESIAKVFSVDVVQTPATNKGLFEGGSGMKTLREILEAAPTGHALADRLREMADAGMVPPEMPVETEGEASVAEEIMTAFETAAIKIIKDRSMTPEERAKKVGELLKQADKAAESADAGAGGDSEPPVAESATLKAMNRLMERMDRFEQQAAQREQRQSLVALLESAGIEASDVRVQALAACSNGEQRKQLLETWPKASRFGQRIRSGSPLRESAAPSIEKFPEGKDFLRTIGVREKKTA